MTVNLEVNPPPATEGLRLGGGFFSGQAIVGGDSPENLVADRGFEPLTFWL